MLKIPFSELFPTAEHSRQRHTELDARRQILSICYCMLHGPVCDQLCSYCVINKYIMCPVKQNVCFVVNLDDLMSLLDAGMHADHPGVIIDSDVMFGENMFGYSALRGRAAMRSRVGMWTVDMFSPQSISGEVRTAGRCEKSKGLKIVSEGILGSGQRVLPH